MDEAKAAFFLQQRQQEIQREVQLRQMFLQEQLEQQSKLDSMLHQQQLRMIGEHLQEFPDLQQHYQNLLLKEQFQRQEERAILQEHAQIRYQEELRRQQQQQAQQAQQQHQQAQQVKQQQSASNQALGPGSSAAAAATAAALKNPNVIRELAAAAESSVPGNSMAAVIAAAAAMKEAAALKEASSSNQPRKRRASEDSSAVLSAGTAPATVKRVARPHQQISQQDVEHDKDRKPRGRPRKIGRGAKRTSLSHRTPTPTDDRKMPFGGKQQASEDEWKWMDGEWHLVASAEPQEEEGVDETVDDDIVEVVNGCSSPPSAMAPVKNLGTIEQLIAAAALDIMTDTAVNTIANLKHTVTWSESENEDDDDDGEEVNEEVRMAARKGETICVTGFKSFLPQLPVEPECALPAPQYQAVGIPKPADYKAKNEVVLPNAKTAKIGGKSSVSTAMVAQNGTKEHLAVLDPNSPKDPPGSAVEHPYPIDTWWPSTTSIRRERRNNGEESDEDAFTEDPRLVSEGSRFRVNHSVIRRRLTSKVEPGLLEKLPHCKVHRMAMKWRHQTSQAELVHCFQVTELYPNDIMVCCSVCSTWRHAKCGGHFKDYSVRECLEEPFQAICDRCYEEEPILAEFPRAQKRIERQRMEQVRRGLATSAAMRQASFSKHGGTYKWPLGSVTLSHFGGHTRSVHSRHDKAEKQWADMASRLARGHYARQKDRVKVRTKELERLLVSVEDAGKTSSFAQVFVLLLSSVLTLNRVDALAIQRSAQIVTTYTCF